MQSHAALSPTLQIEHSIFQSTIRKTIGQHGINVRDIWNPALPFFYLGIRRMISGKRPARKRSKKFTYVYAVAYTVSRNAAPLDWSKSRHAKLG